MVLATVTWLVILIAILSVLIHTVIAGTPPMPTSPPVKAAVMALLPEDVEGTVYELGAGWGSLAVPLARRYPSVPVVAYEASPVPWLVCRLRKALGGLQNLTVRRANFLKAPLSDAGLVVCYLSPRGAEEVKAKLEKEELRPGTPVLSHTFAIGDWTPVAEAEAADIYHTKVYLYRIWSV